MATKTSKASSDAGSTYEKSLSDDVQLGAYLMSHLRQYCENCGTHDTPQWRKGWHSDMLGCSVPLCNACGLKYHKNQYCYYCNFVYGSKKDNKDGTVWLSCKHCERLIHIKCEQKSGDFYHNDFANSAKYVCPDCKKPKQGKSKKTKKGELMDMDIDVEPKRATI